MALNPNIALAARPVEIADPLAMYGKIAAIQQAQNQNQLAQYQLGAAQRAEAKDIARTNALAQAGEDDTAIANALLRSGDLKGYSDFLKSRRETQKSELDLFDTSMKQIRDMWGRVTTPEEAIAVHEATHRDPLINRRLTALGVTEPMGRQQILEAAKNPQAFAQFVQRAQLGAEKFMEMNKPVTQQINQGGQTQLVQLPGLGGAPRTVGTFADVPLPADVAAQKAQIAFAGRAPQQPVAPTLAQIQDPTNPNQMITIDARRYQGGGVGAPGVIGTTGKAAPVAAAEQKRTEGAQTAQDILDTLRTAYDELDRMRAVPSEQRGMISNALSYVAGTSAGQVAGRVVGTKEQTQRDIIASSRNQMLNAIKNATGMSAQQLNSNVEFRSWLEALTDPTRSIEANRSILDNMEKFIASGGKYSTKKDGAGAAPKPSAPAAPAPTQQGGPSVSNW